MMDDALAAKKKIIWLVDPFEKSKDSQLIRSSALAIQNLFKDSPCVVQPVYFFKTSFRSECPPKIPKNWIQSIQEEGQKRLKSITKSILKSIENLHVIAEPSFSVRDHVNRIKQIAHR